MNKQDRQGIRTFNELAHRYNFDKSFAEIMGVATDARNSVDELEAIMDAELSLKVGYDDGGAIISMINASADVIELVGSRITISSAYFELEDTGKMSARYGVFDNCTIKETCTIQGALVGNTIASNAFKTLTGAITFEGSESAVYGDSAWYVMELSDGSTTGTDIAPMIGIHRDGYGGANIYLAMSREKERGAYVNVTNTDVIISAVARTASKIDLYGATNIYGNVYIDGELSGTTIDDINLAISMLTGAVRELGGNI